MLHRMKLRVLYGEGLASDREARKKKGRVLLLSGLGVYLPFLVITYLIFFETRAHYLLLMGVLTGLVCIPVVLYAYAQGFGRPLLQLKRERPRELNWLAAKIGFFYALELFLMVLGVVEFLLGYHAFRAALIGFVAVAVARDGFEIGYYRARSPLPRLTIFPDGRSLAQFIRKGEACLAGGFSGVIGALLGWSWGPFVQSSRLQTALIGVTAGLLGTLAYVRSLKEIPPPLSLLRFFLWPAFTMACTYFLIFAFLLRVMMNLKPPPALDQAFFAGVVSLWMAVHCAFLGHLKRLPAIDGRSAF